MAVTLPVQGQDPWDDALNTVLAETANQWLPDDYDMAAWTFDPALAQTNAVALPSGFLHLVALKIRKQVTVGAFGFMVADDALGVTAGQNFMGLYNDAGALLASANVDTQIATIAAHRVPFSEVSLSPGNYRIGLLTNASTGPIMMGSVRSTVRPNLNLPIARLRVARQGSGLTALPVSAPAAANSQASSENYFAGLYLP